MDALSVDGATFVETVLADMPPHPTNHEEGIAAALGRTPADEAFALGPNDRAASQDALTRDD